MNIQINFEITSTYDISSEFIKRDLYTFHKAADFIKKLPYGRNTNKNDLLTVFNDGCGTCSTKHAVLKQVADKNNFLNIKLVMGIFKMNGNNTPAVAEVLKKHNLSYIPEAHNYLKFNNEIFDYTKTGSPINFINDLMETELEVSQITDYKVSYHKNFLQKWLTENPEINYNLEEIWKIREECIAALSK